MHSSMYSWAWPAQTATTMGSPTSATQAKHSCGPEWLVRSMFGLLLRGAQLGQAFCYSRTRDVGDSGGLSTATRRGMRAYWRWCSFSPMAAEYWSKWDSLYHVKHPMSFLWMYPPTQLPLRVMGPGEGIPLFMYMWSIQCHSCGRIPYPTTAGGDGSWWGDSPVISVLQSWEDMHPL